MYEGAEGGLLHSLRGHKDTVRRIVRQLCTTKSVTHFEVENVIRCR